ncbi:hypothetical protein [Parasediminibacterium sp. JCM 36343]|uniref:hypothetical protein n=1 Tax=Parasediminibacterium sp. JCM 36343 TaxID=3374279 RepID=UPI0039796AAC
MKSKKTSYLLAAMVVVMSAKANITAPTQPLSGIYETASDFTQKKLSHPLSVNDRKNHLVLHAMFGSSKIDIVENGVKTAYKKSDIFGYRENGVDYRIAGDQVLTVLDTPDFLMYSVLTETPIMKGEVKKETHYYFSVSANEGVKELTKENLKQAFASNNKFRYYIDAFFKSDKDLFAYDGQLKEYKVKYVYEASLKKGDGLQASNNAASLLPIM